MARIQHVVSYALTPTGSPIVDATVEIGGRPKARTDENGAFELTIQRPRARQALTVSAPGFVTNTRVFSADTHALPPVILVPVANEITFDAQKGVIAVFGETRLEVPGDAFVDKKGRLQRGMVRLEYTLLDVTNPAERSGAMGDFSGRMLDGSMTQLRSFGIFQVRVYDKDSNGLELEEKAAIRFAVPIPKRLQQQAPPRVGLFSFDPSDGRWIQEGFAQLSNGLVYEGTITSIGWAWNFDDPQVVTCVTVKVVKVSNGQPIPGITVVAAGDGYESTGPTNSEGLTCLLVQRNSLIHLSAWGVIGTSHWSTYPWVDVVATVPDFASGSEDCGDSNRCPLVAVLEVDLIVGMIATIRHGFTQSPRP